MNCGGIKFLVSAVARILAFIAVVIFVIRVNKIAGCLPFLEVSGPHFLSLGDIL